MAFTYQRPEDQESQAEWLSRRQAEECQWVTFAFYLAGEIVCTRESAKQAAQDFAKLIKDPDAQWEVVGEKRDGSALTLAAKYPGTGCICGSPWFIRAAGL